MALLGAVAYDPASAVSASTASLLAMTALDTTNLRVTFNAPANGSVLVRLKGQVHGATTYPRILLGVLDGSTVRGRMTPSGAYWSPTATLQLAQEASYVITGLTPSNSYTWDAAYGVEVILASTGLKYGGPNNSTIDDAFGAFIFEVWETPTLLAGACYDPASAATLSTTSLLALTAMDTTNLRHTFNAPPSGSVVWRICTQHHAGGNGVYPQVMLGILDGSTVKARSAAIQSRVTAAAGTTCVGQEASGIITGLTPSNSYTFDAAYGVEIVSGAAGLKHGGPNDTTTDNAFGGTAFEIWAA
jgi:hypothetical protein